MWKVKFLVGRPLLFLGEVDQILVPVGQYNVTVMPAYPGPGDPV